MAEILSFTVLIETYWNVNKLDGISHVTVAFVLIETYWNVNNSRNIATMSKASINRNILECK